MTDKQIFAEGLYRINEADAVNTVSFMFSTGRCSGRESAA
jgi:hypothetical protein